MHAFAVSSTFLPRSPKQLWVMDCSGLSTHTAIFIVVSLIVFIFHIGGKGKKETPVFPSSVFLSPKRQKVASPPPPPQFIIFHQLSLDFFIVRLTDFVGCQEEIDKRLSTDSVIIQVGQLNNHFSLSFFWGVLSGLLSRDCGDFGGIPRWETLEYEMIKRRKTKLTWGEHTVRKVYFV